MIDPARFVDAAREVGVDFFTGVPDSLLAPFGAYVDAALPREQHVIAANEGSSVGLAIGHFLATGRPALVYLQNSGIGNTVNPLLSLADPDVYAVPMVLLVGWRGQPGVKDEPQHVKQGRVMVPLIEALGLPFAILPSETTEAAVDCLRSAVDTARAQSTPFVLLAEKGSFAKVGDAQPAPAEALPSREAALQALAESLGEETLNVSTTGMLSRELFEHREANGQDGARDFLTVGGMGHCGAIALGVAMRRPDQEVWCLDGDGAVLMHMGSLAVNADVAPRNFFHVVFNNGVHDSVGGQPTSIRAVDLPAAARAMGYCWAGSTANVDEIAGHVATMRAEGGPSLLELKVRPGNRPGIGRPTRTPLESRRRFMQALGVAE